MTRLERVADNLMRPINPTLILILGVYTVVWGLWLLSPFWTVFTQAPLYFELARFAAEWAWGLFAIGSGLLTLRGAMKPSYRNLYIGSFAAALFWLVIAIFYFMGDWHNTGGITALTFFTYAAVVFVNIRVNRKYYSVKHR